MSKHEIRSMLELLTKEPCQKCGKVHNETNFYGFLGTQGGTHNGAKSAELQETKRESSKVKHFLLVCPFFHLLTQLVYLF